MRDPLDSYVSISILARLQSGPVIEEIAQSFSKHTTATLVVIGRCIEPTTFPGLATLFQSRRFEGY